MYVCIYIYIYICINMYVSIMLYAYIIASQRAGSRRPPWEPWAAVEPR